MRATVDRPGLDSQGRSPLIKIRRVRKGDLAKVQAQFNAWAKETGLPYVHLSRICAMSVGENYDPARLASYMGGDGD